MACGPLLSRGRATTFHVVCGRGRHAVPVVDFFTVFLFSILWFCMMLCVCVGGVWGSQLFYESGVKALLRKLTVRGPLRPRAMRCAGDVTMRCQDGIQSLLSAGSLVPALAE